MKLYKLLIKQKVFLSILVCLLFLCIYYFNMWVSYGFGEAGGFQLKGIMGFFDVDPLESTSHPNYIIVASFFYQLIQNVSFASIMSTVCSAITLFVFCLLGWHITKHKVVVFIFVCMLALTHAFFWLATIPEVYSLHIMLLSIETFLFLKFWQQNKIFYLYVVILLSGFNLGVHQLEAFNTLAIAITTLLFSKNKKIVVLHSPLLLIVFLIGFFPVLFLLYRDTTMEIFSFNYILEKLFVGRWGGNMLSVTQGTHIYATNRLRSLSVLMISFITPVLIFSSISLYKIVISRQNAFYFYLVLAFILELIFVFTYDAADAFTFSLPALFFMYLLSIAYFEDLKPSLKHILFLATFVVQPLVYSAIPFVANTYHFSQQDRVIPYRNAYQYYAHPFKRNQSKGATQLINDSLVIFKQFSQRQDLSDIYVLADWTLNTTLGVAKSFNNEISQITIIPSSRHVKQKEANEVCQKSESAQVFAYFVDKTFLAESISRYKQNQTTLYKINCAFLLHPVAN